VGMVQATLDATKGFIFDVRPMVLDDLGLVPTLRRATRDRGRRAHVPVEFESVGADRRLPVDIESAVFRILDEADREIPVQLIQSRPEGNYWALLTSDIPAMGYCTYRIVTGTGSRSTAPQFAPEDTLQNAFYKLVLDKKRGTIASLVDKELGQELLDSQSPYGLGDFIYEKLSDRHPLEELQPGKATRTTLRNIQVKPGVDGPIWQSFLVNGIEKSQRVRAKSAQTYSPCVGTSSPPSA